MHDAHAAEVGPALSIALALAVGMVSQTLARHLRLPGIVLLLGAGVLFGPDMLDLIRPETLGPAMPILVGFAVAVILFEGGMNLNIKRLRRQALVIRRLLTIGAVVTAAGGTLAARLLMDWDWSRSVLFGTLVVVTGPTVITPLLRRIKVQRNVETVLEAEGVLIDAVGAVMAVVALEIVLTLADPAGGGGWTSIGWGLARLGFGAAIGIVGGAVIAWLLRFEHAVPEGLENVFTLTLVLALFQGSEHVLAESGIVSVTAAGLVVGNIHTRVQRDLLEFKEQLTVMMIGMLFVLLAAAVRIEQVGALGWAGVATVTALMFVVRPLNVAVSTIGSGFDARERAFIAWLGPRGIVAAAVASLFAQALDKNGIPGGDELRALVFMVIALTVLIQGLSGGLVARALGLRRPSSRGYAIVGANELGHALGRLLRDSGEEVVFMDANPAACHVVEQDGFRVVFGNVLEERTLLRAQLDDRAACIAVTTNDGANMLFAQRATELFKVPRVYVGLLKDGGVGGDVLAKSGAIALFGPPRDLELWALRLRRRLAPIEVWRFEPGDEATREAGSTIQTPAGLVLPLVVWREDRVFPVNGKDGLRPGDVVHLAVFEERLDEAHGWLREHGWVEAEEGTAPANESGAPESAPPHPSPETV